MRARVERILANFNEPIPGVMIEQGMLGKNDAARSIIPGNEVGALHCKTFKRDILLNESLTHTEEQNTDSPVVWREYIQRVFHSSFETSFRLWTTLCQIAILDSIR